MPADTVHRQVTQKLSDWKMVRDCIEGARSVKDAAESYLPKLGGQEKKDYDDYRLRAVFFNATARTAEAMTGLLFRKPPEMELDGEDLAKIVSDADLKGNTFVSYSRTLANEVVSVGRAGTLIDWSANEARPYLSLYKAEDIVNWRTERIAGKMHLTLLVLRECYEQADGGDEFAPNVVEQWRVLRAATDGAGVTGVSVEVWRKTGDKGELTKAEELTMTRRESPLKAIPFVFHNADAPGPDIGRVPLADLAGVNVAHYRTSADLENGRHICGLPTPYAFGMTQHGDESGPKEFILGATKAWTSSNAQAKAGFIEFTGQGLGALEKGMEEKEKQMAALGARLIEPPKKDAEAFETVQMRATSEASTLARIGMLTTEGLVWTLAWVSWWYGNGDTPEAAAEGVIFALNKDFVSSAITPEMLTAWVAARQSNLVSAEAFFYNLQRGEAYPDGWTREEEEESIENNPPMPAPLPTPPLDPNNDPANFPPAE